MDRDQLEMILAYVDTHIYEKINLTDLSELVGYSPFYFSRLFSEAMGMPVTGYIRIRKLQFAIVSLLEGRKILDVALLYSFDSHEGFTRAFTQLFGSTPSTIKKHLSSYTVPKYSVPTMINERNEMKIMKEKDQQQNMHQLVFIFLEQSLEEVRAGYCTKIEIELLADNMIRINDNGRGIQLSKDLQASKAVLDKILAGRPITNTEYSQMGDLMNADLQTVNSLCETLHISVYRDGYHFVQDYIRGIAQHDLYYNETEKASGTEIIIKPDTTIFGQIVFSKDMVCDWIETKFGNTNIFTVK